MKVAFKKVTIRSKKDKHFSIVPLGDIHLGNIGCDIEKFLEFVKYIKNTHNCYWIGMGDYIDAINYNDPRFDSRQVDPHYAVGLKGKDTILCLEDMVHRQVDDFKRYIKPIRHKCLGLLTNNHEEVIRKYYMHDITNALAFDLGVPYLGYTAFFKLMIERLCKNDSRATSISYVIYLSHGYGASRKSGAKINRIEDACHFFDCDIVLMGHEHKKLYTTVSKLGITESKTPNLVYKKTVGVMTGCFLKGYVTNGQNYVEKAGYSPTDLGAVKIMIDGGEKNVHVSL